MGLNFNEIHGQTPLDEDEKEGLLIPSISTQGELDEFEQQNIEDAMQWAFSISLKKERILSEKFICNLHKRMFGEVWQWAGNFRKTNKNLGVDKHLIPTQLHTLCNDGLFWIENKTYLPDEMAIRFKHRIVSIHCFPNGNGRHSRLMGDIIIEKIFGQEIFSWGAVEFSKTNEARQAYLHAVKTADNGNFQALLKFARS